MFARRGFPGRRASLRARRADETCRGRKRGSHRLGDELAPVEHDGEKRPHALDPVDLLAGQRFVAIILGEGDEEIGVLAVSWAICGRTDLY